MKANVIQNKYQARSLEPEEFFGNPEIRDCLNAKTIDDIGNLAFLGPPGVGKSLAANLLGRKLFKVILPDGKAVYNIKEWDMSQEGRIETVRTDIMRYCSTPPIAGTRKLAIFTEADNISFAAQQSLRRPMEIYKDRIVFIITANYKGRLIQPILSRCCPMEFSIIPDKDVRKFVDKVIDGEGLKSKKNGDFEEQLQGLVRESRGDLRSAASLLEGWTSGKKLFYKSRYSLKEKIISIFSDLCDGQLNSALDTINQTLSNTQDRTIVQELAEIIRDSKMPDGIKARCLIACAEADRDLVEGVYTYTTMYALTSKLLVAVNKA